jgi:hypothetical protein
MTPKEKAEELFYKMSTNSSDEDHHCSHYVAKNCALIAVDEILKANLVWYINSIPHKYWTNVKKEIQNL